MQDYHSINPEFGTADDLQAFIATAHAMDLYVILDWVANHTAWDCNLLTQHPDWYLRDYKGDFMPTPWWDWDDIIDLDYSVPQLRKFMTDAMVHWVRECDLDRYRCEVAGFVPLDFERVRAELDAVKHTFRMMFVSNHDKNAWEGIEYEQFGEALDGAIVLSIVRKGIPMIYNGQEAGNDRRLRFFGKDEINWVEHHTADFYRRLIRLRKDTPALWSGRWAARR